MEQLLRSFVGVLQDEGILFYSGVPCSILAPMISDLEANPDLTYLPATREDLAIGTAAGAYLAGKTSAVLMQNSGLGYSLNALTSLNLIFKIPLLLVVGFRGAKPGDAPEHWVMGRSCTKLLEAIEVPFWIPEKETLISDTKEAVETMERKKIPVAVFIRPGVFTFLFFLLPSTFYLRPYL